MAVPSITAGIIARRPWYNPSWPYRVRLTVDYTKVAATLTDYPVYLSLTDLGSGHSFWTYAKSTCVDIRITTSDGFTEVPREVVFGDTTAKTGEVHFKASSLSSSANTIFYMYYGNAAASDYGATDTYGRNNTWNSSYVAVWHMQQDPSGSAPQLLTSTTGSYDGTSLGSMTSGDLVAGKLAGYAYDFDGTNDAVTIPHNSVFDLVSNATIQCWVKTSDNTDYPRFVDKLDSLLLSGWDLFIDHTNSKARYLGFNVTAIVSVDTTTNVNDGTWRMITATANAGATSKIYQNGALQATDASTGALATNTAKVTLGARQDGTLNFLTGLLDEVRISSVDRGANWITTEYNNQNSSSTFYSLSSQEGI